MYNTFETMHEHIDIMENEFTIFTLPQPKDISIGYNCKSQGHHSVSVGYCSASTDDNAVAVGSFVSAIHKNSTVLGSNLTSKGENSTLLNQAEFTEDGLHLNSGTSLISDVMFNEKPLPHRCTACNLAIRHGVKWIKDGYVIKDEKGNVQQYMGIELGLCFDCILDCVLEFKAKSAWDRDVV
jgi:hypothetical protein